MYHIKQGCIRFFSLCFNTSFANATPAARPPGDIVFVALLMRRNPCAAKALSVAHNPLSALGKEALAAALEQMAREGHGQMQFLACDQWCVCARRWAAGVGGRRWGWAVGGGRAQCLFVRMFVRSARGVRRAVYHRTLPVRQCRLWPGRV